MIPRFIRSRLDAAVSAWTKNLTDTLAQMVAAQAERIISQVVKVEWLVRLSPAGVPAGGDRILTKTVYDTKLWVPAGDRLITPQLLLNRCIEPEVSLLVDQLVSPGATFVDVGANLGYYTCFAGKKASPNGKVLAFEADPLTCELLRDNIILNDLLEVCTYRNVAVSSGPGRLKLYRRKQYRGNTGIIKLHPAVLESFGDTDEEFEVECSSLDVLLAGVDRPIDFIKIDVEGAESLVLDGMRETVARRPQPRVILEWALWAIAAAGETPQSMLDRIRELGLKPYLISGELREVSLEDLQKISNSYLLLQSA